MPNGATQQNSTEAMHTTTATHPAHRPPPTQQGHTTQQQQQQSGAAVPPKTGLGRLIYGHQSGEQRAAISKKILNGVHTANERKGEKQGRKRERERWGGMGTHTEPKSVVKDFLRWPRIRL